MTANLFSRLERFLEKVSLSYPCRYRAARAAKKTQYPACKFCYYPVCNLHCSPISCCRECTGSSRRGKRDLELAAPEKRLLQNSNSNFRQSLPLIPTTELGAIPSWQPAHLVPYLRKKSSRQNTSLEWVNMIMVVMLKIPVLDKALLPEGLRARGAAETFGVPRLVNHLEWDF